MSSDNAFVSGTGDLRFKSRPGQIGQVLPTACHRCNIFSKEIVLLRRNDAEVVAQTRYTLRRIRAGIIFCDKIKILSCVIQNNVSFHDIKVKIRNIYWLEVTKQIWHLNFFYNFEVAFPHIFAFPLC